MPMDLISYLDAMTDLEPVLPLADRNDLELYQRSLQFVSDSRLPGWIKYLGPRPQHHSITLLSMKRRSA